MKTYKPLTESLPLGEEFQIAIPSFVERNGFMLIGDKPTQKKLGLPRWDSSITVYYLDEALFPRGITL